MKKFIIVFAGVLAVITTTAFVGAKDKTNPALSTFQKEFKGAEDVKWANGKEAIKASFLLNSFRVEAYFTYTGELLGTARTVLFSQLPLSVIREINNRYGSAPVYDIVEYVTDRESFYRMSVETPMKHLEIKASLNGDITVEKKVKK